jgi:tetratricopeptide (TPR) repeat protein
VILARAIKDAPNRFEAYEALVIYYSATENELGAKQNLDRLFALGPEVGDTWYYQALYNAQWGNHSEALDDLRRAKQYNFSLHDRPREQEWLLNLYVSRGRFEETLKFLEFLRTDPGASALHQLRYALLEIEVVYVSGDISRATSLLQELLARVSENDVPLIMHYLNSRNIILKP